MARIELDNISKRFPDGTVALEPTSIAIEDGEFFILVGPSGCGKSTLLNIIVGLTAPTTGEVRVDGRAVTGLDPRDRNMAMVFQSYAIYPHMTVRENLAFPLRLAKAGAAEVEERVTRAAEMLELGALLERRPAELSGGQRQRVAMGRAMVREPAAFLLDEPLSNLDAKLRVQMRDELARLHRRLGTTTVYVTHDQTEAMTLGQRVALLRGGQVQQTGTPEALYQAPANLFVAGFLGSPAMNFLPATVAEGHLVLPMARLRLPPGVEGRAEGRRLVAGIRPEHLHHGAVKAGAEAAAAFDVTVSRSEWLGPDIHVHFEVALENGEGPTVPRAKLAPAADSDGRLRMMARLDAANAPAEGEVARLWFHGRQMQLFDGDSGERISAED